MEGNFLEKLQENNMLDFYLVSLISSDSLINLETCEKHLKKMQEVKEYMKTANLNNKEKYAEMIEKGEEIIKRDLEFYQKKQN